MAFTVCTICDKTYNETLPQCKHCGKTRLEQHAYLNGNIAGRKEVLKIFDSKSAPKSFLTRVALACRLVLRGY